MSSSRNSKGGEREKNFICVPGNFIQNVEFHYWYRGEKGIVTIFLIFFFEKREMDICNFKCFMTHCTIVFVVYFLL